MGMKTELKKYGGLLIGLFLLYLCIRYWSDAVELISLALSAALPLLVGCVIAYILNILMSFFERHYFPKSQSKVVQKSKRAACMLLAFISLIGIIALIIGIVVPELTNCAKHLFAKVPVFIENSLNLLEKNENLAEYALALESYLPTDWASWEDKLMSGAKTLLSGFGGVMSSVVSVVSSVFSTIVTFFVALIFSIYLLLDKEKLISQSKKLISTYLPGGAEKIFYVLHTLNDSFHRFIVGQCTEAVVLGVLCMIGMAIFGFPYAMMIGVLIGFTALIPVAGAYIGAGVGAFMILTESPLKALLFLIFIVILQQVEGNLIYPRVVGSSIGLPGMWVLAAITIGGGLMGIMGMLLAVPIVAAIYKLIQTDVRRRNPVKPQPIEVETEEETEE